MHAPSGRKTKIIVFSGAGISAESGIPTFRDQAGLWSRYDVEQLSSTLGWQADPALVLDFYNQRREQIGQAKPNAAHRAIAELEKKFEVIVITQNVDDLHERAGSQHVIHLHGEITKARSTLDPSLVYDIGYRPITLGKTCELNSQLRPDIVWFGEEVKQLMEARHHMKRANKILVVGTSLQVYPAAHLVDRAPYLSEKICISLDIDRVPRRYKFLRGKAASLVPMVTQRWLTSFQ